MPKSDSQAALAKVILGMTYRDLMDTGTVLSDILTQEEPDLSGPALASTLNAWAESVEESP